MDNKQHNDNINDSNGSDQNSSTEKNAEKKTKPFNKVKILIETILLLLFTAVIVLIIQQIFGTACLLKLATGMNCPFCGMTRAHIAFFKLDFAGAFAYHPLFFLGIPFILALVTDDRLIPRLKTPKKIFVIVCSALFITIYFIRIFTGDIAILN